MHEDAGAAFRIAARGIVHEQALPVETDGAHVLAAGAARRGLWHDAVVTRRGRVIDAVMLSGAQGHIARRAASAGPERLAQRENPGRSALVALMLDARSARRGGVGGLLRG